MNEYFSSAIAFKDLLTHLADDDPKTRIDPEQLDLPDALDGYRSLGYVLKEFSVKEEAKRCPRAAILVIVNLYRSKIMIEEAIRKDGQLVPLLILFARYVWPAYLLWIHNRHVHKKQRTWEAIKRRILEDPEFFDDLEELGVVLNREVLINTIRPVLAHHDASVISRWNKSAVEQFYWEMCRELKIQQPTGAQEIYGGQERGEGKDVPDGPVGGRVLTFEQLMDFQNYFRDSPLFERYAPDVIRATYKQLWKATGSLPTLPVTIDAYLDAELVASSLTLDQRLLAKELLRLTALRIVSSSEIGSAISRRILEIVWNEFHRQDISPLLTALLERGILVTDSVNLAFGHSFIFDFFVSQSAVTNHLGNPLPPLNTGINLTRWVWWLTWLYCDADDPKSAANILLDVFRELPGFTSGSWEQLVLLLAHLPATIFTRAWPWVIGSIAVGLSRRFDSGHFSHANYADLLSARIPPEPGTVSADAAAAVREYLDGLDSFISQVGGLTEDCSPAKCAGKVIRIARAPFTKWNVRLHALSSLRKFPADLEIQTSMFTQKPLHSVLDAWLRNSDEESKTEIAATLLSWGDPQGVKQLSLVAPDYRYRVAILRGAADGLPGYREWV